MMLVWYIRYVFVLFSFSFVNFQQCMEKSLVEAVVKDMPGKSVQEARGVLAQHLTEKMGMTPEAAARRSSEIFAKLGFTEAEMRISSSIARTIGDILKASNLENLDKDLLDQEGVWNSFLDTMGKQKKTVLTTGANYGWKDFQGFSKGDRAALDALVKDTGVSAETLLEKNPLQNKFFKALGIGEKDIGTINEKVVKYLKDGSDTSAQLEQELLSDLSEISNLTEQDQKVVDYLKKMNELKQQKEAQSTVLVDDLESKQKEIEVVQEHVVTSPGTQEARKSLSNQEILEDTLSKNTKELEEAQNVLDAQVLESNKNIQKEVESTEAKSSQAIQQLKSEEQKVTNDFLQRNAIRKRTGPSWQSKVTFAAGVVAGAGVLTAAGVGAYLYRDDIMKAAKKGYRSFSARSIWGIWSLYYNQIDALRGQYIYGNTSGISTLDLQKTSVEDLENKLITDWFVCGEYVRDKAGVAQKNADGSHIYAFGTKFDPDRTRVLVSLVTFEQYDRTGNVTGWFGKKGEAATLQKNISERIKQARIDPADYPAIDKKLGISSFSSLRLSARIGHLRTAALTRLSTEQKKIQSIAQTLAQETPTLPFSVQELVQTAVVPNRDLRKASDGNYYRITPANPTDDDTIFIVVYNVKQKSNGAQAPQYGYVYEIAPGSLAQRKIEPGRGFIVTGRALDLMRLEAGVAVAQDGAESLQEPLTDANMDVSKLLRLSADDTASYAQKVTTAATQQEKELYEQAYASSVAVAQARSAKFIIDKLSRLGGKYAQSKTEIKDFYLNATSGEYLVMMARGADTWYASCATGKAYDMTGNPRIRPAYTFEKNTHQQQILVNKQDPHNIALFSSDALGLKQIEYQSPLLKQATTHASYPQVAERTVENTQNQTTYVEYKLFTPGPLVHSVILKESPVNRDTYEPLDTTVYTISEKMPGYLNFKEVGTYIYDPKKYFTQTTYRVTVGKGYVADDERANRNVAFIWNGDDARIFTQLHYQRQLITLIKESDTQFSGTINETKLEDDENGITREVVDTTKTRPITVTKQVRNVYAGITENVVTITDGEITYEYAYQPTAVADMPKLVRDALHMQQVTDAYGITRLAYVVPDTYVVGLTATDVRGVPADKKGEVAALMNKIDIKQTKNNALILYRLQKDDPLGHLSNWRLDLQNGVLYDVLGVPQGAYNAVQLQTLKDTLHLGVSVNAQGKVVLEYRGD